MARAKIGMMGRGVLGFAALVFACAPAFAQSYGPPYYPPQPYSPPPGNPQPYGQAPYVDQPAYSQPAAPACCVLPAGTEVAVELVDPVGTHERQPGDVFALRLAAPLIVDGQVVLAAGAPGLGRVIDSAGPGLGGKGAKLVLDAEYLSVDGGAVALQGLQLAGVGKDQSMAANAASIGAGFIFMPLGLVGFAVRGGDIEVPAGTAASARTARAVTLRSLARATPADYAKVRAVYGPPQGSAGWVTVPPPPPGMGQVVFFRAPSLMGTGQWFNVRENGAALGKLTNGAYFVQPLPPGIHQFTAKSEPELNDSLNLKIDPGETYYVEGVLTKGLIIGLADLTPSDKARFDAVSGDLAVEAGGAQASAAPLRRAE